MFLPGAEKAIERNRVLSNLRVNQQRNVGMQVAQSVERRDWNMHEVTDTPDVYQNLVGTFVSERAAKLRDHLDIHPARDYGGALAGCQRGRSGYSSRCRSIESITPITAASMGE